jgi:hypothetical protein
MKSNLIALVLASLSFAACDAADRTFDCTEICNRWKDCADSTYDVDVCVNRCESNGADDQKFDTRADRCENCLDDRTCGESFACTADCIGIVP